MKQSIGWIFVSLILLYCSCSIKDNNAENCIQKDTLKIFYSNGKLRSYDLICQGLKNGVSHYYLEDGTLEKSIEYRNNIINGRVIHYYPNGKVRIDASFKDGKLNGKYKIYDEKGDVIREVNYKDGHNISR